MSDTRPIVIIGTGLAGYSLGREIRKNDKSVPIVFITSDDGASYSKPMLSTGFSKNKSADDLAQASVETMAEQLNATIYCHSTVTDIDRNKQQLSTDKGDTIKYAKLVFATGSHCIDLPIAGNAVNAIHHVNNLQDYRNFRQSLEGKKSVFIIGAGLIGCEYANDLGAGGFQVTCIDLQERVLASLLPDTASKAVQQALQAEFDTVFKLGHKVKRIDKIDNIFHITMTDNDGNNENSVTSDVVLSAVGVRANTSLAKAAGLAIHKGIMVDAYLQTSDPNIFALGDCAEVDGHLLYFVMPLMTCARALAPTLLGNPTPVRYNAMAVGVKTPVCPVQVIAPSPDLSGEWSISGDEQNVRALFHNTQGELRGFALTGDHIAEKITLTKALPPLIA